MILTYLGGEFVKIQWGELVLAFNPPSKESKLKTARFGADIILSTRSHPDMNGVDTLHGPSSVGAPFIIQGAGEYEIKGVSVRGFDTESAYGVSRGVVRNTVYVVHLEGMKLCFLGALSSAALPAALMEELDDLDILLVPIGGAGVLSPQEAEKLVVSLEPRLIIPMHFEALGEKGALPRFLKEAGEEKSVPQDKLTIRKKDLEGKEAEIVVLRSNV